ncbi:MAG: hypothetical protein AAFR62_15400 [Cyanobacteria bacterium J06629_2]
MWFNIYQFYFVYQTEYLLHVQPETLSISRFRLHLNQRSNLTQDGFVCQQNHQSQVKSDRISIFSLNYALNS